MALRNAVCVAVFSIGVLLSLCSCAPAWFIGPLSEHPAFTTLDTLPGDACTRPEIRNFTFHLAFADRLVRLDDGVYEAGTTPDDYIFARLEQCAAGDADGDGDVEVAVVLSSRGMGSGAFYELTMLVATAGQVGQTDSIVVGDRVGIESLAMVPGGVLLAIATHAPNDPSCCPSRHATRRFRLSGRHITEVEHD